MMITMTSVAGSGNRVWRSNDGVWEVVMFGMGRFRLYHLTGGRTELGQFPTLQKAEEHAYLVQTMLLDIKN